MNQESKNTFLGDFAFLTGMAVSDNPISKKLVDNQISGVKKYPPIVYAYHDLIKSRAGKKNALNAYEVAYILKILSSDIYHKKIAMKQYGDDSKCAMTSSEISKILSAERKMRWLRQSVNDVNSPFMIKVMSCDEGLYAATQEEVEEAYEESICRKIKAGATQLREARSLIKSLKDNKKLRLKLSNFMKEAVEIGVTTE